MRALSRSGFSRPSIADSACARSAPTSSPRCETLDPGLPRQRRSASSNSSSHPPAPPRGSGVPAEPDVQDAARPDTRAPLRRTVIGSGARFVAPSDARMVQRDRLTGAAAAQSARLARSHLEPLTHCAVPRLSHAVARWSRTGRGTSVAFVEGAASRRCASGRAVCPRRPTPRAPRPVGEGRCSSVLGERGAVDHPTACRRLWSCDPRRASHRQARAGRRAALDAARDARAARPRDRLGTALRLGERGRDRARAPARGGA